MSVGWSEAAPVPGLGEIAALQIRCECCGHTRRLEGRDLRSLAEKGYATPFQLKPRLVCSQCKQKDFDLMPVLRLAG